MTYQNTCAKCRESISVVGFGRIPKDFYRFFKIYLEDFDPMQNFIVESTIFNV